MGAKNSTERVIKNLDKILGEDDEPLKNLNLREEDCKECDLKKNKKDKKDKKDKKYDKDDKDDNRSLLSKPIVKGGCKQCAMMNK
jgi:hypothetical protein